MHVRKETIYRFTYDETHARFYVGMFNRQPLYVRPCTDRVLALLLERSFIKRAVWGGHLVENASPALRMLPMH